MRPIYIAKTILKNHCYTAIYTILEPPPLPTKQKQKHNIGVCLFCFGVNNETSYVQSLLSSIWVTLQLELCRVREQVMIYGQSKLRCHILHAFYQQNSYKLLWRMKIYRARALAVALYTEWWWYYIAVIDIILVELNSFYYFTWPVECSRVVPLKKLPPTPSPLDLTCDLWEVSLWPPVS